MGDRSGERWDEGLHDVLGFSGDKDVCRYLGRGRLTVKGSMSSHGVADCRHSHGTETSRSWRSTRHVMMGSANLMRRDQGEQRVYAELRAICDSAATNVSELYTAHNLLLTPGSGLHQHENGLWPRLQLPDSAHFTFCRKEQGALPRCGCAVNLNATPCVLASFCEWHEISWKGYVMCVFQKKMKATRCFLLSSTSTPWSEESDIVVFHSNVQLPL